MKCRVLFFLFLVSALFPPTLSAEQKKDSQAPQVSGETLDPATGDTVWIKVRPDGSRITRRVGKGGELETSITPEEDRAEDDTEGLAVDPESGDIVRAIYTPSGPGKNPARDSSSAPVGFSLLQGYEIRENPAAGSPAGSD